MKKCLSFLIMFALLVWSAAGSAATFDATGDWVVTHHATVDPTGPYPNIEFEVTAIYTIDQNGDTFDLAVNGNPVFTGTIIGELYTITDNIQQLPPWFSVIPPYAVYPSLFTPGRMILYDFDPGDYSFTLSDSATFSGQRSSIATGDVWDYGVYKYIPEIAGGTEFSTLSGYAVPTPSGKNYVLKNYLPLKKGITWNYLQVYNDGTRNYETFCVGGTEVIDGEETTKEWEFDSGEIEDSDYNYDCVAWTGEGLKLYKTVDSEGYSEVYNPPAIGLPFKMRIGDTFETSTTVTEYDSDGNIIGTNDIYTHMTLLAEEDIIVKAGSFTKCLKLLKKENDEGKWSMAFVWLAHGIGEIKRDVLGSEVRELISLTMPGKTFVPGD